MTRLLRVRDPVLFALALVASLLGLFFVFDAGYARSIQAGRGAISRELVVQFLALCLALPVSALAGSWSVPFWRKASKAIWLITMALLVAVAIPGLGHELNGATRWLKLGPVLVQPAEFAKLTLILYLAGVFANSKPWSAPRKPRNWGAWLDAVLVPRLKRSLPVLWVLLATLLVAKEPDLGTAAVMAVTAFAVCWAGGASRKALIGGVVLGGLGVGVLVLEQPYRVERIAGHFHRYDGSNLDDMGYQTVQSELSMASGGIIGVGAGGGRAKHVLPAATTDFLPATIAEEFGFLGWLVVAGILAAIAMRLFVLAARAPTHFGGIVLAGVGAWIAVQSVTNLAMANGFLPAIGIPLPFLSSGGSSLIALWIAHGLCQASLSPEPAMKEVRVAASRDGWRHGRPRLSRA